MVVDNLSDDRWESVIPGEMERLLTNNWRSALRKSSRAIDRTVVGSDHPIYRGVVSEFVAVEAFQLSRGWVVILVDILMSPEFWMSFPDRLSCYVVAAVVVLLQEVVVWAVVVWSLSL